MSSRIPLTEFVSSERVPIEVIHKQASALSQTPYLVELTNATGTAIFLLNQQRQIIFASAHACQLTARDPSQLLGLRPGEALGCVHARKAGGDCGCTEYCQHCGALKAIVTSLQGKADTQELRITRILNFGEEALDLLVFATPFVYQQEHYTVLTVTDISHEKRRRVLEHVFYHDLINLAGGLEGFVDMLKAKATHQMKSGLATVHHGLQQMLEEIQAQKQLVDAETNELEVHWETIDANDVLSQLRDLYEEHPTAHGRAIRLEPCPGTACFTSDRVLVKRILGNLIKNGLEAISKGQAVTLGCSRNGTEIRFSVHSPSFMPKDVQRQLFKRSFSTKGSGRGLGTYSVKLLTEKYLKGKINLTSSEECGTTFHLDLPGKM